MDPDALRCAGAQHLGQVRLSVGTEGDDDPNGAGAAHRPVEVVDVGHDRQGQGAIVGEAVHETHGPQSVFRMFEEGFCDFAPQGTGADHQGGFDEAGPRLGRAHDRVGQNPPRND